MTSDLKHHEYVGVIHIHSKHSDGSGTVKKIVDEARKANLDYIIIGDHNNIEAKLYEGWHDGVMLLVGEEVGAKGSSHYLALDIEEEIDPTELDNDAQKYIDEVKRQNGLGFIAHPYGIEKKQFRVEVSSWDDWDSPDYTGMEIWSYMHDWSDNVNLLNIVYYYFKPDKAIEGPPTGILQRWDQLCQKRRVVGIGSSDVHARYLFPFTMFKFLSYGIAFQGVRTHLLLPSSIKSDFDDDKRAVYDAFGNGHCFFAYDYIADSKGFRFEASVNGSENLIMGDETKLEGKVKLIVTSPFPSKILLIKDGQLIKEMDNSLQLYWETDERGVYRVEAQYNGRKWVYTNPIYLR